MKIAVFGAGAVGGHLAARLVFAGTPVSLVARGAHLDAIRAHGLTLRVRGEDRTVRPEATDQPADLGPQDLLVVSVKGPGLPTAMRAVGPLIGPETRVAFAMNGLPWWFLDGLNVTPTPQVMRHLDPDGAMDAMVPRARAVAAVVASGGRVVAPGVIENTTPGNAVTLGYPVWQEDPVVAAFAEAAARGGYRAGVSRAIREDIWRKLLVNASAAMLAALLDRTTAATVADPEVAYVCTQCVAEILAVGDAIGVPLGLDPAKVVAGFGIDHRPSVLQDLTAGRPLELGNIILVVRDLARATGVPAPHLTTVAALIAARAVDSVAHATRGASPRG